MGLITTIFDRKEPMKNLAEDIAMAYLDNHRNKHDLGVAVIKIVQKYGICYEKGKPKLRVDDSQQNSTKGGNND